MLLHYLKVSIRILFRNKLISGINLFSLSAGICVLLLIAGYLEHEKRYDDFHKKGNRISRAGFTFWDQGKVVGKDISEFSAMFAPDAKAELTGIDDYCRITSKGQTYISYGDRSFKSERVNYADRAFFDIFSFRLLEGNAATVLKAPNSIVLDRTTALKLFGNIGEATGKIVLLDAKKPFLVTGVAEDAPSNTDIHYTCLLSFSTLASDPDAFLSWQGGYRYETYLLLSSPESAASVSRQLPAFMWRHLNKSEASGGGKTEASLQPLADIHLKYNADSASLSRNLLIFTCIAVLILIISCVNYVNFNTAQSFSRFKEIGVRRVLGAERDDLSLRWMVDSVLITGLSFCLAILLVLALNPFLNLLTGKELNLRETLLQGSVVGAMSITFIVISVGAGAYLTFYLRKVSVRKTLMKSATKGPKGMSGNLMTILQFVISAALISCTLVIYQQVKFIRSHPTGIDRNNILILPLAGLNKDGIAERMKQQLSDISNVTAVSGISQTPIGGLTRNGFLAEGQSQYMMIHQLDADEDLLKTFGLKMKDGRYFAADRRTDSNGYVINETLARSLGWKDPLGKTIDREGKHRVIGVIRDFNFASLHEQIEPLIITIQPWEEFEYMAVRYNSSPDLVLEEVKEVWKKNTRLPFDYSFADTEFDRLYKSEQQFMRLLVSFSLLSILLSLSGIFGLVSISIQKRIREFGIRKVLGASVADIVALSASGYFRLVLVALTFAIPVSIYLTNRWLEDFAYHSTTHWWIFLLSSALVLGITMITVAGRVLKAAMTKPTENLRAE